MYIGRVYCKLQVRILLQPFIVFCCRFPAAVCLKFLLLVEPLAENIHGLR